jgi:hypothetical protein
MIDFILFFVSWLILYLLELYVLSFCIGFFGQFIYSNLSYIEAAKILNPIIESLVENPLLYLLISIQCILIYSFLESSFWRATVGKKYLGL